MVNVGLIVLLILAITFFVLIFLVLLGVFKTQPVPQSGFAAQQAQSISLQAGFSTPAPVDCPSSEIPCRGNCLLYSTFSTELDIVNGLTPISNEQISSLPSDIACADGFTQALQLVEATCQQEECVGRNGQVYGFGQTEQFYVNCEDLPNCSNPRSAVVFNFNLVGTQLNSDAVCLAADTEGTVTQFFGTSCSTQVGLNDIIFLNVNANQNGLYQIRAPGTGNCLVPNITTLVSEPCNNSPNGGFGFALLTPFSVSSINAARNYPTQFVQQANINQTAISNGITTINTNIQTYNSNINNLTSTQRQTVNGVVLQLDVAIANANCSQITSVLSGIQNLISGASGAYLTVLTSLFNIATSANSVFNLLGTCGAPVIYSLQINASGNLVLAPLGSCPSTEVCDFNTQIVSVYGWNCGF